MEFNENLLQMEIYNRFNKIFIEIIEIYQSCGYNISYNAVISRQRMRPLPEIRWIFMVLTDLIYPSRMNEYLITSFLKMDRNSLRYAKKQLPFLIETDVNTAEVYYGLLKKYNLI